MVHYLAQDIAPSVPLYLTFFVAICWAVVKWKNHPQVSMCAIIGIGVLATTTLTGQVFSAATKLYYYENADEALSIIGQLNTYSQYLPYFNTAAWSLILVSIFGWRAYKSSSAETGPADQIPHN